MSVRDIFYDDYYCSRCDMCGKRIEEGRELCGRCSAWVEGFDDGDDDYEVVCD